jgi:hypothetical protein
MFDGGNKRLLMFQLAGRWYRRRNSYVGHSQGE